MVKLKLGKLLYIMGKVGIVGFGGGNAIIPILQKKVVDEAHLIEQDKFNDTVIIANITPGALPIEVAAGIGKQLAGWKGMIISSIGIALPGVFFTIFLMSIISYLNEVIVCQIEFITVGINAYIACILTQYITEVIKDSFSCVIMMVVFLLTCEKNLFCLLGINATPMFGLSTIHIFVLFFLIIFFTQYKRTKISISIALILSALYISCVSKTALIQSEFFCFIVCIVMFLLASYGLRKRFKKKDNINFLKIRVISKGVVGLIVLEGFLGIVAGLAIDQGFLYMRNNFISSFMSFGGGDTYLTIAEGVYVDAGLVTENDFFGKIIPLINILPGSILCKTSSAVGYCVGYNATKNIWIAYLVAFYGFMSSIIASCSVIIIVENIYQKFEKMDFFQLVKYWIGPIISGLMMTVILTLMCQNRKIGVTEEIGWISVIGMIGIYCLDIFLYCYRKWSSQKVIFISAIISLLLCNFFRIFKG